MNPQRRFNRTTGLALALAALISTPAWATNHQGGHGSHGDHAKPAPAASAQAGAGEMSDGEVRRVDKDAKKLTLKHGEIRNLEMPSMTMVFQVRDPALLDKIKVGDKVKFRAEKAPGGYAVTAIELANQ